MSRISKILENNNIGLGISSGASLYMGADTRPVVEYTGDDAEDFESIVGIASDSLSKFFLGDPREALKNLDALINNPRFKTLVTDNKDNVRNDKSIKELKKDIKTALKKHVAHPHSGM